MGGVEVEEGKQRFPVTGPTGEGRGEPVTHGTTIESVPELEPRPCSVWLPRISTSSAPL